MQKIINETEVMAYDYLKAFGFSDDQIKPLINRGTIDLQNNLTLLESLLCADVKQLDEISNVLHALKGLIYQLGNHRLAEKLSDTREHLDDENVLREISQLLLNGK